jgi:hypothetical protein
VAGTLLANTTCLPATVPTRMLSAEPVALSQQPCPAIPRCLQVPQSHSRFCRFRSFHPWVRPSQGICSHSPPLPRARAAQPTCTPFNPPAPTASASPKFLSVPTP